MKFKIRNSLSATQIKESKLRFSELIKIIGGVTTLSRASNVPLGTIKSIQGSKSRVISPKLANEFCALFADSLPKNITREYLRSDMTKFQWDSFDSVLNAAEEAKKPEPAVNPRGSTLRNQRRSRRQIV